MDLKTIGEAVGATAFAAMFGTLLWSGYYLSHMTHPDLEFKEEEYPQDVPTTWRDKVATFVHWGLEEHKVERNVWIFVGNARNFRNALVRWHPDADIMDMTCIQEKILGSAIRHPDGMIYATGRNGRHHHCIHYMAKIGRAGLAVTHDQGFITTHGRYVDRVEGLRVAKAAQQLIRKTNPTSILFSEDLW
jgi:hypothetical protein